jgi:hypothetical protein
MKDKWIITCMTLLCFVGISFAQEDRYPETVYIKIYEPYVGTLANQVDPKIVITDPDNLITNIPLAPSFRLIDDNKEFEANQLKIRIELQKWHNKGFQIKAFSAVSPFGGLVITNIVLQKN